MKSPLKLVKEAPLMNLSISPNSLYLFIALPRHIQKYFHKNNFNFCSLSFIISKSNAVFGSNCLSLSFSDKLFKEKLYFLKKLYFSNNFPNSVLCPIKVIGFILTWDVFLA